MSRNQFLIVDGIEIYCPQIFFNRVTFLEKVRVDIRLAMKLNKTQKSICTTWYHHIYKFLMRYVNKKINGMTGKMRIARRVYVRQLLSSRRQLALVVNQEDWKVIHSQRNAQLLANQFTKFASLKTWTAVRVRWHNTNKVCIAPVVPGLLVINALIVFVFTQSSVARAAFTS